MVRLRFVAVPRDLHISEPAAPIEIERTAYDRAIHLSARQTGKPIGQAQSELTITADAEVVDPAVVAFFEAFSRGGIPPGYEAPEALRPSATPRATARER